MPQRVFHIYYHTFQKAYDQLVKIRNMIQDETTRKSLIIKQAAIFQKMWSHARETSYGIIDRHIKAIKQSPIPFFKKAITSLEAGSRTKSHEAITQAAEAMSLLAEDFEYELKRKIL
tara:strand:+ start:11648 stop:11998 length:351 start_codon:yes stop_codon:yes gene_type:complete